MIASLPDLIARRAELTPTRSRSRRLRPARASPMPSSTRASARAAGYAARGACAGDRVAILCRNRVAFFEMLFAAAKSARSWCR